MNEIFTENPGNWTNSGPDQAKGKRHRKRPNKPQATPQSDIAQMLEVLKGHPEAVHTGSQPAPESPAVAPTTQGNTSKATAAEKANNFRAEITGAHLTAIVGSVIPDIDMAMYVEYVDAQLRDAGNPTDPLERLLIEQTLLLHHLGARFATKGCMTLEPETSAAFGMVSGKLFAEARRNVLGIAEYRERNRGPRPEGNPVPALAESANSNQLQPSSLSEGPGKINERTELRTNGKCQEPDPMPQILAAKRPTAEIECCAAI